MHKNEKEDNNNENIAKLQEELNKAEAVAKQQAKNEDSLYQFNDSNKSSVKDNQDDKQNNANKKIS